MNQLYELSRQFPDEWIKKAPKGKFGNYIPHSVITQRLLEVCGPYTWEVVELIRQEKDGKVVGCFGKLTVCLLYTSPSPRDGLLSRMPSSA